MGVGDIGSLVVVEESWNINVERRVDSSFWVCGGWASPPSRYVQTGIVAGPRVLVGRVFPRDNQRSLRRVIDRTLSK